MKIKDIQRLDDIEENRLTLKAMLPIGTKVSNLDDKE
jgi:hypothetical protein